MIEKLLDEEYPYGEPEYSRIAKQITGLKTSLEMQLTPEGKDLLEQISDAYLHQNTIVIKDAFMDGFCTAFEIILDVFSHIELPL